MCVGSQWNEVKLSKMQVEDWFDTYIKRFSRQKVLLLGRNVNKCKDELLYEVVYEIF